MNSQHMTEDEVVDAATAYALKAGENADEVAVRHACAAFMAGAVWATSRKPAQAAKEPPSEITNNRGSPMGPWGHE